MFKFHNYNDKTTISWTGDRSASSRIERIKKQALENVKTSYPQSGYVKNETEKNSRRDALARVRGGGAVVPPKVRYKNIVEPTPKFAKIVSGNRTANMDTTGGTPIFSGYIDDDYFNISTDFIFYFFGVECGLTNNIYWSTNAALTFDSYSSEYQPWDPSTAKGILLGQTDLDLFQLYEFSTVVETNYILKRLVIESVHHNDGGSTPYRNKYEIRIFRTNENQFIEVSVLEYDEINYGQWNISDGNVFLDIFPTVPPVDPMQSFVLSSDLNGDNWVYNANCYVNIA